MTGDVEEEFERRHGDTGSTRARLWLWHQILRSVPINLVRRTRGPERRVTETSHFQKGDHPMTTLMHDLQFAGRSVTRNKRLAATIIATLAIGIAATTVIFSVIDGIILSPFPFSDPARLVGVGSAFPKINQELSFWENLSPAEYVDVRESSKTLVNIVAWDMGNRQVTEGSSTDNVFSAFWWGDALPTLGIPALIGRGFTEDEVKGGKKVALVSYRFWENRMGKDASRVGNTMIVNGESYTLVGILPKGALIYGTDLWIPMSVAPDAYPRGRRQFQILARLAQGVSMAEANTELGVIAARTDSQFRSGQPEYESWRMEARSFVDINVGFMRPAAVILFFAALFVLLIACVNVASMLLARAMERSREMATRISLGARRGQIVRQLICESTLHALLGGIAGTLLATQGLRALQLAISTMALPIPAEIGLSFRVLSVTLFISLLSGFLFGLAPALYTVRAHSQAALRADGRESTSGGRRLRAHRFFVGFQMTFAALLVACSGLLIRSLVRLQSVDPGIATRQILGFRTTLATERYQDEAAFQRFFETLEANLAALPGVTNAALASQTPPLYFSSTSFRIEGEEVTGEGSLKSAYFTSVSPNYFGALGVALKAGRLLSKDDRAGTPPVVVINEMAAKRYFPKGNALGKRLRFGKGEGGIVAEIVGIVAQFKNRGLDRPEGQELFVPLAQTGFNNQLMTVVRTSGDPLTLTPSVREAVRHLDPLQPIYMVQTMDQAYASIGIQRRIATFALLIFAALALLLSCAGVYSVASYAAAARNREIGVRMAVGASARDVRRMVARQALAPVSLGAALGLMGAVAAGKGMGPLLFQVQGYDPLTLILSGVVLSAMALLAADGPARKASRTDLVAALNCD